MLTFDFSLQTHDFKKQTQNIFKSFLLYVWFEFFYLGFTDSNDKNNF